MLNKLREYIPILVLGLLGMVANAVVLRECSPQPAHVPVSKQSGFSIIRDTIHEVIHYKPVVYQATAKVVYDTLHDTTILTKPFVATHDTTIGKLEAHTQFIFPQMVFRQQLIRTADSIIHTNNTILIHDTTTIHEQRSPWLDVLSHVGAFGLGTALGYGLR
jgi:hypothetical protein